MIPILTVSEYETIKIGNEFSKENKTITKYQANFIDKWEKQHRKTVFKWGYNKIIPQQWVGILGVPGLQIEILPKIKIQGEKNIRRNLLYMLSIAMKVPFRVNDVGNFQTGKISFLECYIQVFIDKLIWAIKKGIIHNYVQTENNENFIRGKLVITKQLQKNIFNKTKFFIRYDEYSINNVANRILKATIIKLINIAQSKLNQKNLHLLKEYFSEIDERKFCLTDFSKLNLTRTDQYYYEIFEMCRLFWREQLPDFYSGEVKTFNLLFDMNKIYEKFIYNLLVKYQKEILNEEIYIENKNNHQNKYLFRNNINRGVFKLVPDIIISHKMNKKIIKIIDTKWKILDKEKQNMGINQADIYQMYTYAREFDCKEIFLLYPQIDDDYQKLPAYHNETFLDRKIRLTICTVNLNINLPDELNKIIEELKMHFRD
jgi:5-methylcytosine-specific restriction enzyme subunit McrC